MGHTDRTSPTGTLQRWHGAAYWALLAVAVAVMLVMSLLTTLKEDDMAYSLVEGLWTPVQSLQDVLRSFQTHYSQTNGRIADLLAMLYSGWLGKTAFDVCNALVFGLLLHLLSLLSTGRRSVMAVACFLAVVGTCYPVPGETMLWMAGSCNYLWAITASLLLVAVAGRRGWQPGWLGTALLALGAFVAGAMNEATSLGFLVGLCLYWAMNRGRVAARVSLAVLLGYAAGVALIVGSPGAWSRAADGGIVVNLPVADLLASRWHIFHEKMWRFYLPVLACAVLVLALLLRRGGEVRRSLWPWVLLCLALEMFALGINHERAYAPLVTVSFIIVMAAAGRLLSRWPWARVALTLAALALSVFTFARSIKVLEQYRAFDQAVTSEITAAPDQAVLLQRQFEPYSRFVKPANYISTNFFAHEIVYRTYYGKKNVQFVSDSVYARYHEGRLLDGAQMVMPQSDRPDLVGPVYLFPDQDYMAITLKARWLPCSFQTARYYRFSACGESDDPDETARRHRYGLPTDYDPHGFYPLLYQGQCYLITDAPFDPYDMRMTFPLSLPPDPQEVTLHGL
ncbi:MAG: hypothetical protein IJV05_04995 [Muribaculaceae bacterium]|nr:hypothetical protein [Muribaculaceae bacterium]